MKTKTTVIYKRQLRQRKSFFLCGAVILISLLTAYVLLTLCQQLKEANALLMEIKQRNLASNITAGAFNWRQRLTENSESISELENNIFKRIAELARNESDHDLVLKQDEQRRFQESVYMIRKRFYETHSSRVGNFKIPRGAHVREPRVDSLRGKRANVIIVAYHRSGSSFLGEMFNRNPNAFYLFEPIHTIDGFLDARRRFPILYDTLVRNLLDTIFHCHFKKHPLFVNTLTTSAFRLKSQALTSHGLCDVRATSHKMHLCQRINATTLTKVCSARLHTVVKTIRMAHWENLDFLAQSNTLLKVIHLVRDPRGIIASRVSWILERFERQKNTTSVQVQTAVRSAIAKYVRLTSGNLCKQLKNDIYDWTKRAKFGGTYAMIRYEDVANQPQTVYKQISEFAGIAQSNDVIKWLTNNTKYSSDSNYYSTTRNSSAVPHLWRSKLPYSFVQEIQKNCADVMGILGYKLVHSKQELIDMRGSLVIDWSSKGYVRTKPYIEDHKG